MTCNLINKRGIPVLAFSLSDPETPRSCSLAIKYDEARLQATISLQSSVLVHGSSTKQTFTLVYNADNLVPGETNVLPSTRNISEDQQREISRQGTPSLKAMSLALKKHCVVWCPPSSGSVSPQLGFESSFYQLAKLARATEIRIIFDFNWLHRSKQPRLEHLMNHLGELSGYTADNYANRFRQTDCSVFRQVEDQTALGIGDVVPEALPSYEELERCLGERTNKRGRQTTPISTFDEPDPKRILLSPAPDYTPSKPEKYTSATTHGANSVNPATAKSALDKAAGNALPITSSTYPRFVDRCDPAYVGSPTEKATTASTPSPRHPCSPLIYTPLRGVSLEDNVAAMDTHHRRHEHWRSISPKTVVPAAQTLEFQEAVQKAVQAALPGALQALLPSLIPNLVAMSAASRSPSPCLTPRRMKPRETPRSKSSLRALLNARVAAHAEAQLQNILNETLDHATELRNTADVDFYDFLEEQKFDVTTVKDDSVAEINCMFEEKITEFRDCTEEILEVIEQRAEMVFVNACDRLDALVGRERACLRRERDLLESERRFREAQRRIAERDAAKSNAESNGEAQHMATLEETQNRSRRAISVPLW